MSFIAFESRLETGRPETIPGLRRVICDGNAPWGHPVLDRTKVNREHLAGVMKRCRDIGAPLKLDIRSAPIAKVNDGIRLLREIGDTARDIDPSVRLGHYGLMPRLGRGRGMVRGDSGGRMTAPRPVAAHGPVSGRSRLGHVPVGQPEMR